jgi:hypothetical protein
MSKSKRLPKEPLRLLSKPLGKVDDSGVGDINYAAYAFGG